MSDSEYEYRCECTCRFATQKFNPDPLGVAWYKQGQSLMLGNQITYTWFVYGNPRRCKYSIDETGSTISLSKDGVQLVTLQGQNNSWGGVQYGSGSATTVDNLGIGFPANAATGKYIIAIDLRAKTKCVGSDGKSAEKTFPAAKGAWEVSYPN
jgi:hypothetical protein